MGLSGISSSFPELFRTEGRVPTCYSPVCRSRIATSARLACVKPAASVRSEPGSNSQVGLETLNRLITTFDEVPPYLLNAIHIANNDGVTYVNVFRRSLSSSLATRKPKSSSNRDSQGLRRPRFSFFIFTCQTARGPKTPLPSLGELSVFPRGKPSKTSFDGK